MLRGDEVHVWLADLNQPAAVIEAYLSLLSVDERERAESFLFQRDRDHYILARGILREIVARYLKIEPKLLCFAYNAFGKPALVCETGQPPLRFNISHSHEIALYAVGYDRELGIDVEYIRQDIAAMEIAEHFFSSLEIAALRSVSPNQQTEAFYKCWTRKEAYIKAVGQGFSRSLDQFDVSLSPGEPAVILRSHDNEAETLNWTLREIALGSSYAAAVTVEGSGWSLSCWEWLSIRTLSPNC